MSLFGDLDIANAQDDPFKVEDGTYSCTVTGAEVKKSEEKGTAGLLITYTVTDEESPMYKRTQTEWKNLPTDAMDETEKERAKSFLKIRLNSLGVPKDKMNSLESDDLIGIDCVVTVKTKGEYSNVTRVELPKETSGAFL